MAAACAFLFLVDSLAYVLKGCLKKMVTHRARPGSRKQMPAENRNDDSGELRLEWCPEFARTRPGEVRGGGGAGASIPWEVVEAEMKAQINCLRDWR